MNHDLPPFDDPAREREWLAQERALDAERRGLAPAGDNARVRRYRLLARALREPMPVALPADFARRMAAQAAVPAGGRRHTLRIHAGEHARRHAAGRRRRGARVLRQRLAARLPRPAALLRYARHGLAAGVGRLPRRVLAARAMAAANARPDRLSLRTGRHPAPTGTVRSATLRRFPACVGDPMHIEPPNTRLASLRDFAKHYLMIVLSILTALGLEAWIEHAHHAHAAEAASLHIRTELQANLADVRTSIKTNQGLVAPLRQLDDDVARDIRDGVPAATINQYIQAHKEDFRLSINWPTFASQSWDVAVANQSASWMDDAVLRR